MKVTKVSHGLMAFGKLIRQLITLDCPMEIIKLSLNRLLPTGLT